MRLPQWLPCTSRARRRTLLLAAATLLAAGALWLRWRPVRTEVVTQRRGEPPIRWRVMREAWRFSSQPSGWSESARDLLAAGGRLYYLADSEVGCLAAASGQPIWRSTLPGGAQNGTSPGRPWGISCDDRLLYAVELQGGNVSPTPPPSPYHVRALALGTGRVAWERTLAAAPVSDPCPAGDGVLVATRDGFLNALRRTDGSTAWRSRLLARRVSQPGESPCVRLRAERGIAVAQLGAWRLAAYRVRDGARLWAQPPDGPDAAGAEEGDSEGFALRDGVAYAMLGADGLYAFDAATGRRLWVRRGQGTGSPAPPVVLAGGLVVTERGSMVAMRQRDGATAWYQGRSPALAAGVGSVDLAPCSQQEADKGGGDLLVLTRCDPLVSGVQRKLRSVSGLPTVIALDPATGRERWRWQAESGCDPARVIQDGRRLYVADYEGVYAMEDGPPASLPADPAERQAAARALVSAEFGWPALRPGLLEKAIEKLHRSLPWLGGRQSQAQAPAGDAPDIALLRLGADSVPALVDYVRHEAAQEDASLPPTEQVPPGVRSGYGGSKQSIWHALDLLLDIGDRAPVPDLAQLLGRTRHRVPRCALACALIRFDDARALPILFDYARSPADDLDTRQDALYAVCGTADGGPPRAQVTAYLLSCLRDPRASGPLRRQAMFALLDDRGDGARRAALSAFRGERTARLLPANPVLGGTAGRMPLVRLTSPPPDGFPTQMAPLARCRDEHGLWWAAFYCDYLGDGSDLWIAQSPDDKRWVRPAFALNLGARCTRSGHPAEATLHAADGALDLKWMEQTFEIKGAGPEAVSREFAHRERIAVADLYRDADGDGLPDRLELAISADPGRADTDGDGVPDGLDKCPAYRPGQASDEAGILQAAIEALCQVGRLAPGDPQRPYLDLRPYPFGRSRWPLVLPAPPGVSGVEVLGHPGPVICRPVRQAHGPRDLSPMAAWPTWPGVTGFAAPLVSLSGALRDRDWVRRALLALPSGDPFAPDPYPAAPPKPPAFHDLFPYELSADGTRARVGWSGSPSGSTLFTSEETVASYDVEVRKVGGHWYPVECRLMSSARGDIGEQVVLPGGPVR